MIQQLPLLYSFRRCPYAIRTRLSLFYANVTVRQVEVDLKNKPPEMLALSPKGTVPVLLLPNGQVLDESWDIMRWAFAQNNDAGFFNEVLFDEAKQLMEVNDFHFKPRLDRYKYADRHPERAMESYRDECLPYLYSLDNSLKLNNFFLSNKPNLIDLAVFPFIRQFAFVDKDWFDQTDYPRLQKWLNYWLNTQAFTTVMQKSPATDGQMNPINIGTLS